MLYEIKSRNGDKISICLSDDGTVIYTVGKRKTVFSLADCYEYNYLSCKGTKHEIVGGECGVNHIHLIILFGEDRLQDNNDERESKGQWRLNALDDKGTHIVDKRANVESEAIHNMEAKELHIAISKLKSIERKIACMYWFEGFKQAEIAEILGMSHANVRIKCHRILKNLKKQLKAADRTM